MDQAIPRHEKIRFRRGEIASLDALPSAGIQEVRVAPARSGRATRIFLRSAGLVSAMAVIIAAAFYFVSAYGVGSERLRLEAEAAIGAFAGADVDVASQPARLSLGGSRFLGLEVPGMSLTDKATGEQFAQAGSLRFGLRLWPLLAGDVQLRSVSLADARILPGAAPDTGPRDWSAGFRNGLGLIEPDLVIEKIFSAVHRLFDAFEMRSTRRIELENIEVLLSKGETASVLRVAQAVLSRGLDGRMSFTAELELGGRVMQVEGSAARAAAGRRVSSLDIRASSPASPDARPSTAPRIGVGRMPRIRGALEVLVTGEEAVGGEAARLAATMRMDEIVLELTRGETLAGSAELAALLVAGTGKVEVERLRLATGRSRLSFNGAFGPSPFDVSAKKRPAYRYELVSNGSTLAAADASEPALDVLARVAGTYLPVENRLNADEIGLRTALGEVLGTASVDFAQDKTPSVVLAIDVPSMPVAQIKQLWPWTIARGARQWVMANAFGGTVKNSRLRLSVGSGRLGNGLPLGAEEISGHFQIENTRLDMTGDIPPLRDVHGVVDFRGSDIDISLSSGTVFMPEGRTVAASGGKFLIRDAHVHPVIGKLDIDVAGEAPAMVKLASYRPIEAMKGLDLLPEDFSGALSGNVKADIPLERNIPAKKRLGWSVALDYSGLSVAKPFAGQTVTEAEGTIEIDPAKAVIKATARLNGIPAELDLIEPVGASAVERQRNVTITLDDEARETLAPGLSAFLSGPVRVDLEAGEKVQRIAADLTEAKLTLPFAGWTKGAGIPATASFELAAEGEGATISNFKLDGDTFGASGEITLAGGGVSAASFGSVRLNRDDSVTVAVKRSGKGYEVTLRGDAIDARPLIKQFTAEASRTGPAGKTTPIALDATLSSVTGFGGEALKNVKIAYRGVGSTIDALTVSAVSKAGGAISIKSSDGAEGQSVQMQSADAGALLRFLDVYGNMEGGNIRLALDSQGEGPLRGQIDARDFWLVDEPRLSSIVSTAPAGDGRSLNQAVRRDIDTSRVRFDRGFSQLEKGDGYLTLANGVLRGPLIGTTFQGTLFDAQGNMSVTGTFMPAYGLNRLFAEIPLIGRILGNGRDRGLIGITYKLAGDAKAPKLQINPISAIAPGIFRSIFEFN